MDQTELISAVEALTKSVGKLSDRLDVQEALLDRFEAQRRGLRSTRVALAFTAFGLSLDLVLTVMFGLLYQQVNANTHQVQSVQARTSAEILCPLYQVFALSIKINPVPTNYTPEQLDLRQHAADTILAGLEKLGCAA
jgi:hypothetical protein